MSFTLEINRWQEIMALLHEKDGKSISRINHDIIMTYSHTCTVVSELEKRKLIKKKSVGREIQVFLTADGRWIAQNCADIEDYLTKV